MNELLLRVADIEIKIISEVKGVIERFNEMYYNYKIDRSINTEMVFEIVSADMDQYINFEKLPFKVDGSTINTHYIYTSKYDSINKKATLITNNKNIFAFSEEFLLNLFSILCLEKNKLLFHCTFLYDDDMNAYILYGPSGIGKSTITRNAKGLHVLSDDLAVIEKISHDSFRVHKTPFERNKTIYNGLNTFKIKGIYRLHHAAELHAEKLNASQKMTSILGNIWNLDFSSDTPEKYFELINNLFKSTEAFSLSFEKNSDFSQFIKSAPAVE